MSQIWASVVSPHWSYETHHLRSPPSLNEPALTEPLSVCMGHLIPVATWCISAKKVQDLFIFFNWDSQNENAIAAPLILKPRIGHRKSCQRIDLFALNILTPAQGGFSLVGIWDTFAFLASSLQSHWHLQRARPWAMFPADKMPPVTQ